MVEKVFASVAIAVSVFFALISFYFGWSVLPEPVREPSNIAALPRYTAESLLPYNGENGSLPILLALNGYVYDVTPGREYYGVGAVYHDLAGKDSSELLNSIGGDIIARKYEIVGTYSAK